MCGISGWVSRWQDVSSDPRVLRRMRDSLAHRGPDECGEWVSTRAALLHRRLTVVDPAGGAQPMTRTHHGRTCVLVYNGELYNTADLRSELLERGHGFSGYSDTEVLLAAYVEWGRAALPRLNGIFAFAVWDVDAGELFLARDRLGVKPLFYHETAAGDLLFGSEIKALLVHPIVPRVLDAQGLCEVFLMGPARTPGCGVLRDIHELKPGCFMRYGRDGTTTGRYWNLVSRPHIDSADATVEHVRLLLADAVSRQLISDVPVCSLLSGGLDSSAITALIVKHAATNGASSLVRTFSVDYKDQDQHFSANYYQPDSDNSWAGLVAETLGTAHKRVELDTPALVDGLRDGLKANDLPGMADIDSSLLLFCREIKREATVALSGEAADEIFGGYPWFKDALAHAAAGSFPWARLAGQRASLLAPELRRRLRPLDYLKARYDQAISEVPVLGEEDAADAARRTMSYLNITRFMPTLLDRKDRMSMAAGLEVRVPFCDHRLVEYCFNVPWALKTTGDREKGLLRSAMEGLLPSSVLQRRKSPYPKTHNPAFGSATREWLADSLAAHDSPLKPLLDVERVNQVLATGGDDFAPSWFGQLMGPSQLFAYLAQIDFWLREYRISVSAD